MNFAKVSIRLNTILILVGMVQFHIVCAHQQANISTEKIKQHVLNIVETGGRLTGTQSESKAALYITKELQSYDLTPWHSQSFSHAFDFISGIQLGSKNKLLVNSAELDVNKDYRPVSFSGLGEFSEAPVVFVGYGITEPAGEIPGENYDSYRNLDVTDKWVLMMRFMPENIGSEMRKKLNQLSYEQQKVINAKKHGAKGVIFVHGPNTTIKNKLIPLSYESSRVTETVPVISVSTTVANLWFQNINKDWKALQKTLDVGGMVIGFSFDDVKISAQIDLIQSKLTGSNIIATIKSNSDLPAIILGAHYDHLGHGETSNSLASEHEVGFIHPGADDNASGVAALLSIAEHLSKLKMHGKFNPKRDIVFAFWSGEELGLLGSKNFVKNIGKNKIPENFLANINLDMVGRLDESLIIQGINSSEQWPNILEECNHKTMFNIINHDSDQLSTDALSFYLSGIPVISLFTGFHNEYHSPNDTIDLINFKGIENISRFVTVIIQKLTLSETIMEYTPLKTKNIN